MIEVDKISGISEYEIESGCKLYKVYNGDIGVKKEKNTENDGKLYKVPGGKVFLVERKNTLEVRTDTKLGKLLREKYESVMESRYFGKRGIEIVQSGQLDETEIEDLVRLSYNLTREEE